MKESDRKRDRGGERERVTTSIESITTISVTVYVVIEMFVNDI